MRCRKECRKVKPYHEGVGREVVVGDVIEFGHYRKSARGPLSIARLEGELALPSKLAAQRKPVHHVLSAARWPVRASTTSDSSVPVVGIAIIVCAILVYAILTLHVVGQVHYSARANLMPPVWTDD
jgi:hypothetical protein